MDPITESTLCVNCAAQTYHDSAADQRYNLWSHLTECYPAERFAGHVATTKYSERTRMAIGRDDEQTECMLIGGEIVR